MYKNLANIQFKNPFTCMVAGPTTSGKTVFVTNLLRNRDSLIGGLGGKSHILWWYRQWQSAYEKKYPEVEIEYFDGLPSEESLKTGKPDVLVI